VNNEVIAGLPPHLRLTVLQKGQTDLEGTIRFATIAELNGTTANNPTISNTILE
jgi:hypothetical protein